MRKINWKRILVISYWILVIGLLVYSRFINLDWGLPYPMHPDERNMANAVQSLQCEVQSSKFKVQSCFNPNFFAYGQFPLYLAYFGITIIHFFTNKIGISISFVEAVMALRFISAIASILTVIVMWKIIYLLINNLEFIIHNSELKTKILNSKFLILNLAFIFSPGLIQFAHFGTTESLLMLFYLLIIWYSILFIQKNPSTSFRIIKFLILNSVASGLAIATKMSSLIFMTVPVMVLISNIKYPHFIPINFGTSRGKQIFNTVLYICLYLVASFILSVVFSPHNLINFKEFVSSLNYESAVATGGVLVFYTRQFVDTIPVLFQITHVFPYVLGWPIFILFILGFIFLPWKKEINLLRFAFIAYFFPNAFLFAKWTRFMAPVLPIMIIVAVMFLLKVFVIPAKAGIQNKNTFSNMKLINWIPFCKGMTVITFLIITLIIIFPGVAYLSVYQNPDVRFQASEWIYKNIPDGSYILSETANVVDIPFQVQSSKFKVQNYQIVSFNFYDLDQEKSLQEELKEHLEKADYIFVPSRRIFANNVCENNFKFQISNFKSMSNAKCQKLKEKYPLLNEYYKKLFNGELGFKQVAEFSVLQDEQAEETWSVFDHPVIRIFKKVKS